MDDESFRLLIARVSPKLTKCNTVMRDSISANERLSVTLRFLATGNDNTYVTSDIINAEHGDILF